jgi:hypothetical protein
MEFKEWFILNEKLNGTYDFSCVLEAFPEKYAREIIEWGKQHIPDDRISEKDNNSGGREDEIHVTALYGLHTKTAEPVKPILAGFEPFHLTLGKISKFPKDDFDVIKIEVTSSELTKINKNLKELDHTTNYNTFNPHCTIAYVKKDSCNDLIGSKHFAGKVIPVKSFKFSSSNGDKTIINL